MAFCFECGEKVAENDVFCPFCGISLPPIAVASGELDNLAGDALPAPQPELETTEKNVGEIQEPVRTENKINGAIVDETPFKIAQTKTDDFSNEITSGNLNLKTESVDVPAGVIDDEAITEKSASDEQIIETLKPVSETPEAGMISGSVKNVEDEIGEAGKIKPIEEINTDPVFTSTEGETAENKQSETEDRQTGDAPATDAEMEAMKALFEKEAENKSVDSDAEIKAKSPLVQTDKNNIPAENFQTENKFETPEISGGKDTNLPGDNSRIVENPIVIPEVELPAEDKFPPSQFDSVSIMEKEETVEEIPSEAENQLREKESTGAETSEPQREEISSTQGNIGVKDTNDKKKTKLKPLDEGTVLNGRYEIIRKIGGGGMGAVYLASDKNLGGVLRAVKEMVQSYIEDAQQEKAVNDFKRESLLLTSLDHQSIPTIYDYFFDEKEARFYLVMRYISGGDLSGRLRSAPNGRIDEVEVTKWAIQIADVLDYLHNRQPPIVYRDLKPANVMVDSNSGRVMLIDFGIARWVNKEEKGVTAVGTMGYAPPELFSGNVEARSDIYSLGSTMFHLLTGADPQSNPLLIFDFQKHPRPRQINPQLSDQIERILMRAVEYNADKRFASAADLRKTLEEHLENLKTGRVTFGVKEAPVSVALSDQPVFCGFCGQKIVATDMFCAFCGAKQPLAQQGVHSESYAPAPLTAQLLIIGTSDLEQPSFRLEKDDNLVGRRDPQSNIFPEVDLSKYDPQTKISRRHARIWREGSEFMVEDLGSSNGTFILPVVSDTVRLQPHQPQALTNGDKLKLGDTTLHFVLG
ncbi:MAG: protein kinase domain-containing protein [Pyrinomonadaceae bacterium]